MKRIPDILAILLALTLTVSAGAKDRKKQPVQAEKPQREYPSLQFRADANGRVAPSLAFFHIELLEYIDAWVSRDNPRWRQFDAEHTEGARGENNGGGALNSGMFAAMYESGSVIGTSCGHAHDGDYIAIYHGIALTYGRFSGGNTIYNHLPPGGRMFLLREGQKGFETWIREYDGRVVRHVRFDGERLKRAPGRGKPFGSWTEF